MNPRLVPSRFRWALDIPCPEAAKSLTVLDAEADAVKLAGMVDFCFWRWQRWR